MLNGHTNKFIAQPLYIVRYVLAREKDGAVVWR